MQSKKLVVTTSMVVLALLAFTGSLPTAPAHAAQKKTPTPAPTPPPLDGGTIYYSEQGVANPPVHELAPDGTQDRVVAGVTTNNTQIGTRPSGALHNGKRWFVQLRDVGGGTPFFPDNGKRYDAFVLTEGGASPLRLTDTASQCIQMSAERGPFVDWAPNAAGQLDHAIAWVGTKWADAGNGGSPCDTPAGTGIYRAELTFDAAGEITGIVAQPSGPDFPTAFSPWNFSFRPDGQQLAYESNRKLYLVPDPTGLSPLNGGKWVADPAWSPTGAKIAFHGNTETVGGSYATFTINPDGTGLTLLAQGRRSKKAGQTSLIHRSVRWSPNGTHLVYTEYEVNEFTLNIVGYRIHRMTATGSDNVVLPAAGPKGGFALGWGGN